jgi:spermidine synthase
MVFPPGHTEEVNREAAEAARWSARNTDNRPVTYLLGLRLWRLYSGSGMTGMVTVLSSLRPVVLWLAGLAVVVLLFLVPHSPLRRRVMPAVTTSCCVAALSGFAGISVSLLVLFSFQNAAGALYGEMALLVACYMAGLCLGAMVRRPARGQVARPAGLLLCVEGGFAVVLFAASLFLGTLGEGGLPPAGACLLHCLLMLLAGFLGGAEFALLAQAMGRSFSSTGFIASVLEAADCGGAVVGALLTGLVLLPVLGVIHSLVLLGLVKAAALAMLLAGCYTRAGRAGMSSRSP